MRNGRPWGLSGPEFLELYGFALVAVVVLCGIVWLMPRPGRAHGRDSAEVGLYEQAFLNGGATRVADTALAGLLAARTVRINRMRQVSVHPREKKPPQDEFQELLLNGLKGRTRLFGMLRAVRSTIRRSGLCEPLERGLRERGLIVSAGVRRLAFGLLALFPLLLAAGVVRAVNGAYLGYPVAFLIMELIVTLIAWRLCSRLLAHPLRTAAGEAVRRRDLTPPGDAGKDRSRAAARVARKGLQDYPDTRIANLLHPPKSSGGAGGGGGFGGGHGGGGHGGGGCGGGGP
jgi:uncharacterized protein (TIGR04222 family)